MTTLHDFHDGKGPVPAHQHSNGGGWVADTAKVADTAYVGPDAWVYDNARVYRDARVYGNAEVYGNAIVSDNARISSNARVYGNAWVYDNAKVYDNANVYGNAQVYNNAWVFGNTSLSGDLSYQGIHSKNPIIMRGTRHSLILDSENQLQIGCILHPIDYWLENYEEIGRRQGYTEDQIKEYGELIKDINELYVKGK